MAVRAKESETESWQVMDSLATCVEWAGNQTAAVDLAWDGGKERGRKNQEAVYQSIFLM